MINGEIIGNGGGPFNSSATIIQELANTLGLSYEDAKHFLPKLISEYHWYRIFHLLQILVGCIFGATLFVLVLYVLYCMLQKRGMKPLLIKILGITNGVMALLLLIFQILIYTLAPHVGLLMDFIKMN